MKNYNVYQTAIDNSYYFEHKTNDNLTFRIEIESESFFHPNFKRNVISKVTVLDYDLIFDLEPFHLVVVEYFQNEYSACSVNFLNL